MDGAIGVGTWVLGDVEPLIARIKGPDGVYRDLTGATVTLQARPLGDRGTDISVAGVVDADQVNNKGKFTVSDITTGVVLGKEPRRTYLARIKYVIAGGARWTKPFQFEIEKWP